MKAVGISTIAFLRVACPHGENGPNVALLQIPWYVFGKILA